MECLKKKLHPVALGKRDFENQRQPEVMTPYTLFGHQRSNAKIENGNLVFKISN